MPVDHIRYDLLTQQALRAVVRRVLSDVAKTGSLPGEHHFYVTFDTRSPGVKLSPRLREQYPEEMTIVLQHQFWDLAVTDAHFEVALSFNGISEKLHVPLEAIKGFFDPSVQFGLQFETATEGPREIPAATEKPPRRRRSPPSRGASRPSPSRSRRPRSALPFRGSSSRPKPSPRRPSLPSPNRKPSPSRRRSRPRNPSPTSPRAAPRSCGSTGSGRSSRPRRAPDQFRAAIRIGRPFSGRSVMRANGITSAPSVSDRRKRRAIMVSASSASCMANVMPTQTRAPAPNGR